MTGHPRPKPARRTRERVDVPWPVQVYVHGTCRTAWAESRCTCGRYTLHWVMKQVCWSAGGHETMAMDLLPNHDGLMTLVAAQVQGPYRVITHAGMPYLRIGPATAEATITIHASPALALLRPDEGTRQLRGLGDTRDFLILREGPTGVRLREAPWRWEPLDPYDPLHPRASAPAVRLTRPPASRRIGTVPAASTPTRPGSAVALRPPVQASPTLSRPVVRPPPSTVPVKTLDLRIPEAWRAFCETHDLHPEQGDYVVLPEDQVDAYPPLTDWVTSTPHVQEAQIVKPREEGR